MSRFAYLLILLAFSSQIAYAQGSFQRMIDSEKDITGCSLVTMSDSSLVLALQHIEEFASDYRNAVMKTDSAGNIVWARTFLGTSPFSTPSIIEVSTGGLLMLAELNSPQALLAIRLDHDGDTLWTRSYPTMGPAMMPKVIECSDGGFAIACNSFNRHAIGKIDSAGELLWSEMYSADISPEGNVFDFRSDVIEADNGDLVSVGFGYTDSIPNSNGIIVRSAPDGSPLWARIAGGPEQGCYRRLAELPDGSLLAVGYIRQGENEDVLLSKFSSEGELLWSKSYDGGQNEHIMTLSQKADGSLLLSGYSRDSVYMVSQAILMALDAEGELTWSRQIDDGYRVYAADLSPEQGLYMSGSYRTAGDDFSAFLILADSNGLAGCNTWELLLEEQSLDLDTASSYPLGIAMGQLNDSLQYMDYSYEVLDICDTLITHLPQLIGDNDIELHYVPALRSLILSYTGSAAAMEFSLFSSEGRLVHRSALGLVGRSTQIALDNLAEGVYYYRIVTSVPSMASGKVWIE